MARRSLNVSQLSSGIIVPLLIIGAGVIGYMFVYPKYQAINIAREAVASKQSAIDQKKLEFENIKKLIEEANKKSKDLSLIEEAIPNGPSIPELLANFDQLSEQSGMFITSLRLTPAPTLSTLSSGQEVNQVKRIGEIISSTQELGVIQAEIASKGQYPNLQVMLLNFEQNLRLVDIQSLVFGEIDEESGIQEYTLKLQTYYQKGNETTPGE